MFGADLVKYSHIESFDTAKNSERNNEKRKNKKEKKRADCQKHRNSLLWIREQSQKCERGYVLCILAFVL